MYLTGTFMPDAFHEEVLELAIAQEVRKQEYDLAANDTPAVLAEGGRELERIVEQPFNTAILKCYDSSSQSEAYRPHRDPKRFVGKIVLASLSGDAFLVTVPDPDGFGFHHTTRCRPPGVLILDSYIEHYVTPPLDGAERHLLFYGYDITRAAS